MRVVPHRAVVDSHHLVADCTAVEVGLRTLVEEAGLHKVAVEDSLVEEGIAVEERHMVVAAGGIAVEEGQHIPAARHIPHMALG